MPLKNLFGKRLNQVLRSKGRIVVAVTMLVLCAITISAVVRCRQVKAMSTSSVGTGARTVQSGQVVTTLRGDGFTPSEVAHTAGSFTLVVVNESGTEGLNLRLVRENGELVQTMSMAAGEHEWSGSVELASGGYYLTEANHAAWLFHITVQ